MKNTKAILSRAARSAALLKIALLLIIFAPAPQARAQQNQSFYNITGIKTDVLPNAVRVTIQTDGDVKMGLDYYDFTNLTDNGNGNYSSTGPLAKRSFRLRFAGARPKVPSFTEIGQYPVDAVVLSLSRDPFKFAYFEDGGDPTQDSSGTPGIDINLRFYIPIKVPYFWAFSQSSFSYPLQPLEASIAIAPDRRSVVITVITDRVEAYRNPERIRRSPPEKWNHRVKIAGDANRFQADVLHTPLAEVLTEIARVTGVNLEAQPDAAETDVTLFLPERAAGVNLQTLANGMGLNLIPRPPEQGGGYAIGRGGEALPSERLPLRNLSPDAARLLFPDFLLPYLHSDIENNALIANGPLPLLEHLRRDVAILDRPRPQVRVEAQAYELSYPEEAAYVLNGILNSGRVGFDTDQGAVTVNLQPEQKESLQLSLNALISKGRARLAARPFVSVASGATGTLFFGQTRFLPVLSAGYGTQNITILQLPIGVTLTVTPTTAGGDNDILLNLKPKFSTVDAIEQSTGLPTVGIREINSFARVHPGDAVLIAGLELQNEDAARRGFAPFAPVPGLNDLTASRRATTTRTALIVLVTARPVESSEPRPTTVKTVLQTDAEKVSLPPPVKGGI